MPLEYLKAKFKLTNFYQKFAGDEGASIPEILVWFTVIFGLTVVFILFKDEVTAFIQAAIGETKSLSNQMTTG